jgi:hypothetical protein
VPYWIEANDNLAGVCASRCGCCVHCSCCWCLGCNAFMCLVLRAIEVLVTGRRGHCVGIVDVVL